MLAPGGVLFVSMAKARPLALIIEDNPASAEALAFILNDWGADVVIAHTEVEASAAIAPRLSDLNWIITDFHLGDGPNGISVVKRLSSTAPRARVLVLSGSFHGRATAAAALNGYEVMQKPARAEAIVTWLERA